MKPFLIATFLSLPLGLGTISKAQAQIVYGYSAPTDNNTGGVYSSASYSAPQTYLPWGYTPNYAPSGGNYSPISIYVPYYPPIGPNYQLSPVRFYGNNMMGYGGGYSPGNFYTNPYAVNPGFGVMNPRFGGMNSMWMRRR